MKTGAPPQVTGGFSRRTLLAGTAALGLGAALPVRVGAQAGPPMPLAIPPLLPGRLEGGVRHHALTLREGSKEFLPGAPSPTIGINGDYLGPVLSMRSGERVRIDVTNRLSEVATLHWHGLELPAWCDGGPHQLIEAGATWSPEFELRQRPGTYWYHGHRMGHTARHVWMGMAGMIRVEDTGPAAASLPATHGVDDIPVTLQDRWFDRHGRLDYAPSMHDEMMGMVGDVPLANGTINAFARVPAGLVRLRLLNGSNASLYELGFDDGASFWQIASDGGLLAAPVLRDALLLAPGERAEIVIDLSDGVARTLGADLLPIQGMGMGMGVGARGMMGGGDVRRRRSARAMPFLALRPEPGLAPLTERRTLPAQLDALPPAQAPSGAPRRLFSLEMSGMGPGMMMRRLFRGNTFTINGAAMDMDTINEVVPVDKTEVWVIENRTPMAHPFHVHNTQFRILTRDGSPPEAGEAGYKDTVLVWGGERVELLVRFTENTDPDRPYMYHCHILEHEDAGMMGQFTVV